MKDASRHIRMVGMTVEEKKWGISQEDFEKFLPMEMVACESEYGKVWPPKNN